MECRKIALLAVVALVSLAGCMRPVRTAADPTFERGAEMLAAGSPTSAIPLLMNAVASAPDNPEPHAMLALAYALDLQSGQALEQVRKVRRDAGAAPGWECVAEGIAVMTEQRPSEAVRCLEQVVGMSPEGSPVESAAGQWLALALLLKGDHDGALASVDKLAKSESTHTTALLWSVLIQARQGRRPQAAERLLQAAADVAVAVPPSREEGADAVDDQTLYDSAVAAIARGEFAVARKLLDVLQQRRDDASEAPVWLALIAAAEGDWPAARGRLLDACQTGSIRSRGLAYDLLGVVCAMEGRPDAVVQSMVVGQRLRTPSGQIIDLPLCPSSSGVSPSKTTDVR